MSKRTDRRVFLKGLGGAVVAAPFLGSVGQRGVRAQPTQPPARLIAMFTHYGCLTNRFFPEKSHGELVAADLEPTTLAPLAPFAKKLLLPRGIRAMNEWTATLARGQGNDPHLQVAASYFTCHPVTPNSDDPIRFAQATRFSPKATGRSLDHVMAEQLSPEGVPLFLRVSGRHHDLTTEISYSAPEEPFPGVTFQLAFAHLSGLFEPGAAISPDDYWAARGKSIIDLVRDDLATLERFDMSQSDRHKLEAWKELLHETGNAAVGAACDENLADALGVTKELSLHSPDALTTPVTTSEDVADVHSNLAVLAAVCDANPVIFLKYPGNVVFQGLGLTVESHSLSHRRSDAGLGGDCLPGVVDMLAAIDDYHARKFAHLVERLDAFSDGEGTLLDSTAAVWFQEMSDGLAHNLNNLPIVQAGSASGHFKTGWTINVDDGDDALSRGNSELWCTHPDHQAMSSDDVTGQLSGTPPELANAPINKYFCNLMNALGVKAGEDGFPLLGGQAEVTHFGRYDKTEDFIGGGTNPPTIHDPGEFTDLRASSG